MQISIIVTVLNEGPAIKPLLQSLIAQSRRPDEIVIVDGGSTDDTVTILKGYQAQLPLKILVSPGANISKGRNLAIQNAAGPIIASTDAGVRLSPQWLEALSAPFETTSPPEVVAGFFQPDPHTTFEVAMGATVLPLLSDIKPETFLPSSRSIAFTKSAWQLVQGYPEWLDFCEDLIFDFNLKDQCGPFAFAPEAVAYFRPRSTLQAFYKQYYQYARGDGKADLWRKRHIIRYVTYLVALPLLIIVGWLIHPIWWIIGAIIGCLGLFYTPYRRLLTMWHDLNASQKLAAIIWVPIIRIVGDIAKMIGYPVGWWWRRQKLTTNSDVRWRRNQPNSRHNE